MSVAVGEPLRAQVLQVMRRLAVVVVHLGGENREVERGELADCEPECLAALGQ